MLNKYYYSMRKIIYILFIFLCIGLCYTIYKKDIVISQNVLYQSKSPSFNKLIKPIALNKKINSSKLIAETGSIIMIDSLVNKSSIIVIVTTEGDCDYCLHDLIYRIDKTINVNKIAIFMMCYQSRNLKFLKRNLRTNYNFYSFCPNNNDWIRKNKTPFIAILSSNLVVTDLLTFENINPENLSFFMTKFNSSN